MSPESGEGRGGSQPNSEGVERLNGGSTAPAPAPNNNHPNPNGASAGAAADPLASLSSHLAALSLKPSKKAGHRKARAKGKKKLKQFRRPLHHFSTTSSTHMRTPRTPRVSYLLLASLGVLAAVFVIPRINWAALRSSLPRPLQSYPAPLSTLSKSANMATSSAATAPKGQVYFLSHGGPPTMFESASAPYKAWQKYGKMVEAAQPRGLVVVSAHWENPSHSDGVVVNTDSSNPLVYDFYGFPKNFYEQKFESRGDPQMLADVTVALKNAGVKVSTEKRGLDHGVWVPFKVAFDGKTDIPIVQVSLPGDSSPISAAKLGRALATLRDEGYGIMGTGQAVHNLRDYMTGGQGAYGKVFLDAIEGALTSDDPTEGSINLFRHPVYRQAHPTPEHLLPLVVAAAAADKGDALQDIFVQPNGALGWGMWMWKPQQAQAAA